MDKKETNTKESKELQPEEMQNVSGGVDRDAKFVDREFIVVALWKKIKEWLN